MHVLPVLDIQNGLVVRGQGGNRTEYRPIQSQLTSSATPVAIGQAFREFGFQTAYLADLDAITGGQPQFAIYETLANQGWQLWIDAGLNNAASALAWRDRLGKPERITGIIAGLETVDSPQSLAGMLAAVGREKFVFSLDLRYGQPWTAAPAWKGLTALEIARIALESRVARLIVLDVAQVGQEAGVTTVALCRQLRGLSPTLEITTGGGVRNQTDLQELAAAGVDAALVASALHDGTLTAQDLFRLANS